MYRLDYSQRWAFARLPKHISTLADAASHARDVFAQTGDDTIGQIVSNAMFIIAENPGTPLRDALELGRNRTLGELHRLEAHERLFANDDEFMLLYEDTDTPNRAAQFIAALKKELDALSYIGRSATERNYAKRSLKILNWLYQNLDETHDSANGFVPLYRGDRTIILDRLMLFFADSGDPISRDYLKHTMMFLKRTAQNVREELKCE